MRVPKTAREDQGFVVLDGATKPATKSELQKLRDQRENTMRLVSHLYHAPSLQIDMRMISGARKPLMQEHALMLETLRGGQEGPSEGQAAPFAPAHRPRASQCSGEYSFSARTAASVRDAGGQRPVNALRNLAFLIAKNATGFRKASAWPTMRSMDYSGQYFLESPAPRRAKKWQDLPATLGLTTEYSSYFLGPTPTTAGAGLLQAKRIAE